ncbi:MAG: hypothetical protein ACJ8F7_11405 [Gemmataceae bacterium]
MARSRGERRSDEEEAGSESDRPESGPRGPEFFLAVFQNGVRESRIYRGYPDADGLSFVYAGPAILFLDPEVARGTGTGDWKVKAADALKSGLVKAGVAGLLFLGIIIVIAGRLALRDHHNATDLIGMFLMFATVMAVAVVVALTSAVRRVTRRVAVLDAMTAGQIRAEAESEKQSFRATADSLHNVRIDPYEEADGGKPDFAARMSFRHDPTGKWRLILVTRKDARAAARALLKLLGKDGVEVNIPLKKE